MTAEWFRNTTWNGDVERLFDEKLRRARRKEQYLRVQACTLARSHPEVALRLLDRYFELEDHVDCAKAHVDRATALLALGRVDDAIESYEAALRREAAFPNVLTDAWLALPYLIALHGLRHRYPQALQLLNAHQNRLSFPLDRFRSHAARALIAADSEDPERAKLDAERALHEAALEHSGFRYHPSVGLVTTEYNAVMFRIRAFLNE